MTSLRLWIRFSSERESELRYNESHTDDMRRIPCLERIATIKPERYG